jgi:hypothetical protein
MGHFRRILRGCRLVDVRFASKAPKPGPGQKRCVYPDAYDSIIDTVAAVGKDRRAPIISPI